MKTRLLIIIVVIVTLGTIGIVITVDIYQGQIEWKEKVGGLKDTTDQCNEKYMKTGIGTCVLDPNLIEPNTVVIYDIIEGDNARLSIAPHTLVMNLTDGNIVRFVNDGFTTVNVFDKAKGIWRFNDVKPSSQRVLTINSTGFYEILVQNSREGESGRIVVLDNDVNSLSISDRIKMGKAIISDDFRKYPELVSVGAGSGEIGVHVTINKKELELHDDAKSHYHEKFSKIIPFEVPIIIEFGEPIRLD